MVNHTRGSEYLRDIDRVGPLDGSATPIQESTNTLCNKMELNDNPDKQL